MQMGQYVSKKRNRLLELPNELMIRQKSEQVSLRESYEKIIWNYMSMQEFFKIEQTKS